MESRAKGLSLKCGLNVPRLYSRLVTGEAPSQASCLIPDPFTTLSSFHAASLSPSSAPVHYSTLSLLKYPQTWPSLVSASAFDFPSIIRRFDPLCLSLPTSTSEVCSISRLLVALGSRLGRVSGIVEHYPCGSCICEHAFSLDRNARSHVALRGPVASFLPPS